MADPPIDPFVPHAPAYLSIEALEAMIRALGDRIERIAIPLQPPPPFVILPHLFHLVVSIPLRTFRCATVVSTRYFLSRHIVSLIVL
jgi:hypothetical protein